MKALPLGRLVAPLRKLSTCPNCWHEFPPESVRWVAVHQKLSGDPKLPEASLTNTTKAQRRFIPERFDPEGRAIDAEGVACTQLACPRCHLIIPRAGLELPCTVFSILGAPGSGKSVFLTSMVFTMRKQAASLGLGFQDADLSLNKHLLEDERKMFLSADSETYRLFEKAIEKTEVESGRYLTSTVDGQEARFAHPLTFLLSPSVGHPLEGQEQSQSRMLCLYDNAGEQFLPGADASHTPMTRHLAVSKGLLYTFDPTKDRRFLGAVGLRTNARVGVDRQDVVLMEAANRIREHAGISRSARIPQVLIVVVTKFDTWRSLLPEADQLPMTRQRSGGNIECLSMDDVEVISEACKQILQQLCPEIVTAAESVCETIYYIPVAAVGTNVRADLTSGDMSFRSADCEPINVLVPLLTLLTKSIPRLVPSLRRRSN